ncbi:MAG: transglutaminase-like domain-containing protein [Thermoanaerobaculia bacterium]|nr:transglutaminase-like domain-containing protein [Thermoanaerobaculia bacterium]
MTRVSEAILIHPTEARRRFEEFAARDLGPADVAEGALLIALEEYPQLDVEATLERIDSFAERVIERSRRDEPAIFRLGHVHAILFDQEGFVGNVGDYYDERNSFLNEVVERKVGIPITLSILFLRVARLAGLDAHGVGLPGHYLAKICFDLSEVYVDPFHGGRTMTVPEIASFLGEISNGQVALRAEHLRAWSARETLVRVLANLHATYERKGDARRRNAAMDRIEILRALAAGWENEER